MAKPTPANVDAYVAAAPEPARQKLGQLRRIIRDAAPDAVERISYGMPFYELNGRLIYFAAYARHVSLFAAGGAVEAAAPELLPHREAKGTLRFPVDQELPEAAIRRLVEFRVRENQQRG